MSHISPEQILINNGALPLEIPTGETTQTKPNKRRFVRVSLQEIMGMEFSPIKWAIEGYVPEGFSVLAGRQKLGKTWMALDFAIAVATDSFALGNIICEAGNVLYLDLENGHKRIKSRIEVIFPNERVRPNLSAIEIVTESPQLDNGFIEGLEDWRRSVPNPRLVVIDVLQRVKPAGRNGRNAYENDYAIYQDLQSWATSNGIAVLGLHHTRKGGADDPLEALSGSNGLSAVADTTLVLDRDQNGMTLYVRGRDVEEKETAISHDLGTWTILGEAAEVHRSDERKVILECLANNKVDDKYEAMTPTGIADELGLTAGNVRQLLLKMVKAGEVRKTARGRYVYPDGAPDKGSPATPDNNDNNDNKGGL